MTPAVTEAILNWPSIIDGIQAELEAEINDLGAQRFVKVFPGEPLGLPPGGPYACFWYAGRTPPRHAAGFSQVLGQIMYAARIHVACFWPIQPERLSGSEWESDIAGADTSIRRRFRGNSTINNNLTDLDIDDSTVSYGGFPSGQQQLYRALEFDLYLDNLEGEPRTP
jgi:hypothetical protein